MWKHKSNTEEYASWKESHETQCNANHVGFAGNMEAEAVKEMFKRSIELHEVKYVNYIGDGDSEMYKQVVVSKPYGNDQQINKKECINHIEKRMRSRLRNCKENNKGLGGKGKLTEKLIDELTAYYSLAIRRNCDNIENMEKAIWATFYHKISTDETPQHNYCPQESDSWCSWQQAKADGSLTEYKHKDNLHPDVVNAIKPIYEEMTKSNLLERCLGFNQNNNESLNALIWELAPKIIFSGVEESIEIAASIATILFNDGHMGILKVVETLDINVGTELHTYCQEKDADRINIVEKRAQDRTREVKFLRGKANLQMQEEMLSMEKLLYGPGIAE